MTNTVQRKKSVAVSAILGMVIGIGITAGLAGGVYFAFQEQSDLFANTSIIEVKNLNVIRDGDKLTVSATMRNVGQTSIGQILIDEISASDITITQITTPGMERGTITLTETDSNDGVEEFCNDDTCATESSRVNYVGFSVNTSDTADKVSPSILEGGRSQAFKIVLLAEDDNNDDANEVDISDHVNISDTLTLRLQYTAGDDVLLSDNYKTRIRAG